MVSLELINPDGLESPQSYTHVVSASGSRLVFVAGQVSTDAEGNLIGPDDVGQQAYEAFRNVTVALAAAGARPDQVAKITIYVVHHRPKYLQAISEARQAWFGSHKPADTIVGVDSLAESGRLIEVEAIAVVE